jgi:serine/threonine-protein kinase RsbW
MSIAIVNSTDRPVGCASSFHIRRPNGYVREQIGILLLRWPSEDALDAPTVTLRVPPRADHVTLLRTVVSGIAARRDYTLEQVDDLRMAVEEAAVLLLRHGEGTPLELHAIVEEHQLQVRLSTDITTTDAVIDPSSFSWMILQALTDDLSTALEGTTASLKLVKHRHHADHHPEGRA